MTDEFDGQDQLDRAARKMWEITAGAGQGSATIHAHG